MKCHGADMQDLKGVMEWAHGSHEENDCRPDTEDCMMASAIARAMRQSTVWEAHRDKLARFCAMSEGSGRTQYSTINRHTLAKAIRALLSDMDAAREGEG